VFVYDERRLNASDPPKAVTGMRCGFSLYLDCYGVGSRQRL